MRSSSIYIYPTMHYGEGHNNSINEAACFTLPIITTKKGFLGEIFNRDEVFFLNEYQPVNVKEIVRKILYVYKNPQKGSLKATKAKNKLIEKYTSEAISKKLFNTYMKTFKQ